MVQKLLVLAIAMGIILFCAARVSAQEIVNLKTDSFSRWNTTELEQELDFGRIEALAVTLPPAPEAGILFLDGKPLETGRILSREDISRVWMFVSPNIETAPVGITIFPDPPLDNRLKIRCINRPFSPIIQVYHSTDKEE